MNKNTTLHAACFQSSLSDWVGVLNFLAGIPVRQGKSYSVKIAGTQGTGWEVDMKTTRPADRKLKVAPGRGVGLHDLAW